jgi:hypothetical protein
VAGWSMSARPGVVGAGESDEAVGAVADERLQLADVAKLARRARRLVVGVARAEDRLTFPRLIREHLGTDASVLDVVEETWPSYEHVNVQVGLDAWLAAPGRSHVLVGVTNFRHREFDLSELMRAAEPAYHGGLAPGSVARLNLPTGPDGEVLACVVCAVYLVTEGDQRAVLLVRIGRSDMGDSASRLEVAAEDPAYAAAVAVGIRAAALEHNVYRRQVISFGGGDMFGERQTVLAFHRRTELSLDDLILPADTVDAISRQVVGVAHHRERLLAAGQHLKRGLLLYGPPGVGKTHTVRYLMSQLTGTTIVLLAGNTLGMIGAACSVARTLQPAMIVIEDVDLIAEERGRHGHEHPLLFQLLNEMDGLAEDADVVFLLTTNRADVLEPALAQRPGRVDQAVAMELPDADGRRRLVALYRGALDVDDSGLETIVERTDGVTASFLKELLRRAAVRAAEELPEGADADAARPLRVSAAQLDGALDELLDTRNAMTRVLLGGQRPPTADAG